MDIFILDFEKAFDIPLMNYLNAKYFVIACAGRLSNG